MHAVLKRALAGTYAGNVTRAAATWTVAAAGVSPAADATPGTAPANAMHATATLPATALLMCKNLVIAPHLLFPSALPWQEAGRVGSEGRQPHTNVTFCPNRHHAQGSLDRPAHTTTIRL